MGRVERQAAITATEKDKEDAIKKAIRITKFKDINSRRHISIRDAAESCGIAHGTLRDRIAGVKTRQEAHQHQQALSGLDEEAIIRWILYTPSTTTTTTTTTSASASSITSTTFIYL